MKSQFDTLLEGQKQAMEFWREASKKAMGQFNETMGTGPAKKEDFLGNWFKAQKELWEEAMKMPNLDETFKQSPEKLQEWAQMQTRLAKQWMDFYQENAKKMGAKIPNMNGYSTAPFTGEMPREWSQWMEKTNTWIKDNILAKLPYPQGFHYQNFNHLYESMAQYWEPLQRMMQHGITDWKGIETFFKPEAYQEMVGQFMGFKPVTDLSGMLEQSNHYFEQYAEWLEEYAKKPAEWKDQWMEMWQPQSGAGNPAFQAVLSLNNTVREGLESLYNYAGQNREMEMAKLVKDIQFAYMAFILKTVDLQSKVYQAGQFALPDTIQSFYDKYQKEQELPGYEGFFNEYINVLERYMIEVLESDDYSILQSEVAKAGVTVKSKLDQLVELALADFPFLMQSHVDEVAQETVALRKKIRTLESRLSELEARLEGNAKPANGESPQEELLQWVGTASSGQKDDLKQIKGIGPKLESMLNSIGIYTYEQISKMTTAQYELVDELLPAFQGRGQRDKWADQAKKLV